MAAKLGPETEGSQPRFLLNGTVGEIAEGTGEGRLRGPVHTLLLCAPRDGSGSDWTVDAWLCVANGLEIPGTDRLKVNGKTIVECVDSKLCANLGRGCQWSPSNVNARWPRELGQIRNM